MEFSKRTTEMMEETIDRIDIVPAVFIKYREDGNVLLRCLQGEDTVDRAFEPRMFKGMKNLKYLLLGVMTGGNMMKLTICDGNEFENLFHEKWDVLLK
jgi:hypothetical protein